MTDANKSLWWRTEKMFLVVGIVMLSTFAIARLHSYVSSRLALRNFAYSHLTDSPDVVIAADSQALEGVDFSSWNPKRIKAYQESLTTKLGRPLAILRIPKLRIEVPVYEGTDDLTLNRGVGRIIGTARIGGSGNVGIAGHRDGFFRGLKDVVTGEGMELVTPDKTIHYVVEQIEIVQPEDVSVLADRSAPSLTLVTCFPFYFVGDAPQRFIVHAKSIDFAKHTNLPGASSNSLKSKENVN